MLKRDFIINCSVNSINCPLRKLHYFLKFPVELTVHSSRRCFLVQVVSHYQTFPIILSVLGGDYICETQKPQGMPFGTTLAS